jgi:serine protease
VDWNSNVASFSNYNDLVDLAAPGVDILSTVPSSTNIAIQTSGAKYLASYMVNSPTVPQNGVSGKVVSCGTGRAKCQRANGNICLIKRGGISFQEKVFNCQNSGGTAVIIYNNETGSFTGWVPSDGTVKIPVFGIDGTTGKHLRNKYELTQVSLVHDEGGYSYLSGTSMATPHVSKYAVHLYICRTPIICHD